MLTDELLKGKDIALVSDAGTPVISDPGEEIVKEAIKNDVEIVAIPGACALISGLIGSGISSKEFTFMGFLPVNKKEKKRKLEEYKSLKSTLIFYEAPHKLINTLENIKEVLEDRRISLARELTKIHEEYIRGRVSEVLEEYKLGKVFGDSAKLVTDVAHEEEGMRNKEPKGEFVIVVEGAEKGNNDEIRNIINSLSLEDHMKYYLDKGIDKKQAIKEIAKDRNVNKNEIYKYFI